MADIAVHPAPLRAVKQHVSHAHVVLIDHRNGGSSRLRSGTGAFSAIPVSLADKTDASDRATTAGELLAAAHTTSFIATLAELLARTGTPVRELEAHATCEIASDEYGGRITAAHMRVCGRDTQLDPASFSTVCEQALADCPISRALSPGIAITLNARVLDARQSPSPTRLRAPAPSTNITERDEGRSSPRTASRVEDQRSAKLGVASIANPAQPSSRDAFGRSVPPNLGAAGLARWARQADTRTVIPSREAKS
jgi:osmotically inducible protein OsmC